MFIPYVFTRVKKSYNVSCFLIYPGDVRPLESIAV